MKEPQILAVFTEGGFEVEGTVPGLDQEVPPALQSIEKIKAGVSGTPLGRLWDGAATEQPLGLTWHPRPDECVTPNNSKHFSVQK